MSNPARRNNRLASALAIVSLAAGIGAALARCGSPGFGDLCAPPQTGCGSGASEYCAALQTDNANCGACGTVCSGVTSCVRGACVSLVADAGTADVVAADIPGADAPPADVPPADVPPADVPPADVPPADVPPADVPPADVPPTSVVTASCLPATFGTGVTIAGFSNTTYRPGQIFRARTTGTLETVGVGVVTQTANDVIVELRDATASGPASAITAEATIPGTPYVAGTLHVADFRARNLTLTAGQLYAITLRTAAASPNAAWSEATSDCLDNGDVAYTSNDSGSTWAVVTGARHGVFRVVVRP
jgi:hypothetical protein